MSYNVICDRCGFQYKNYELKKEWTGLMVCNPCWEPRHPQDMIKAPREQRPLPYTRPEPPDIDVGIDLNSTTQTDIPTGTFSLNNETL